jgi:membrane associated rhomboid family serine protease
MDPDERVVVWRGHSLRQGREQALVLTAVGIAHELLSSGRSCWLVVAPEDAPAALDHLRRFAAENAPRPQPDDRLPIRGRGLPAVALWVAVLGAAFVAERQGWGGFDWWGSGQAGSELIRGGDWWRAVTALSLHTDLAHLAGNLFFGALFLAGVSQVSGTGAALLGTLLSGGIGNLLNALVQADGHRSVGASTAVFGALGLLGALQWRRRARVGSGRLRRWTPLIIGLVLLGLLGSSGVRVDVVAHVTGLFAGVLLGAWPDRWMDGLAERHGLQTLLGVAAAGLLAGAWGAALQAL